MFHLSNIKVSYFVLQTVLALTLFMQDTVAVQPSQFGMPPEQAITNELNEK